MRPITRLLPASVILVILTMLNYHVHFQSAIEQNRASSSGSQSGPSIRNGDTHSSNITRMDAPCENVGGNLRHWLQEEIQGVCVGNNRSIDSMSLDSGGEPLRVLLVSTWRSGSSFLGDLLHSHPGTFYSYEPLRYLGESRINNGTSAARAQHTLQKLFACKYDELEDGYMKQLTQWIAGTNRNTPLAKFSQVTPCWEPKLLTYVCRAFPVITIKTVRLGLHIAQQLLNDPGLNNLKVIYLVRDPRATMNSRLWAGMYKDLKAPDVAVGLCEDLVKEYYLSMRLERLQPQRFRAIKYKTLTKDIFKAAKDLLDFIGLGFHKRVKDFIETHIKFGDGYAFSTFRDINATASHWRVDLAGNFSVVDAIQNNCAEAMRLWGYENVTENDLMMLGTER